MSRQNSRSRLPFAGDIDVQLAKFGFVVSLLLFSLRLLAEQPLLIVIPVTGSLGFGLYLLTRRESVRNLTVPTLPPGVAGVLPSVVLVGIAIGITLITLNGGRTLGSNLLFGFVGTAIFVQILLVEEHPYSSAVLLAQILLAAIAIRFSTLLVTPGFVGVDIWTHVPIFVEGIVEEGSLSAIAEYKYVMAPIYHLNGAIAALLFDSARLGTFFTIGLLFSLSGLAVYAISRLFVPVRWALLATALYLFSDQAVRWAVHIIPQTMGIMFFLGALYCLFALYHRDDGRFLGLLLVFSLAIVFTHQVSTTIMLLTLAIATVGSAIVWLTPLQPAAGATVRTTLGIAGIFLLNLFITVISWANTPFSEDYIFLWRMLETLEMQLAEQAGFLNLASETGGTETAPPPGPTSQLVPLTEWFGFSILLLLTIIGGIVMLRRMQPSDCSLTLLGITACMFVTVYGLSLFGLRTFMPGRWFAFLYAPMAVLGAIGVYYLTNSASRAVILVVFLAVALGYPTTMLLANGATSDSPTFEEDNPRFAYTEAEIAAVHSIAEVQPPAAQPTVGTDHPYQTLFTRLYEYETETLELADGDPIGVVAVVARDYQHEGPTRVYEAGEPRIPHRSHTFLEASVCSPSRNHVYTNDEVTLCTPVEGGA